MPVFRVKSPGYLDFLSTKKCFITGSKDIDIHHESLLREFSGSLKNHNDFQALPLDKKLHIHKRHDKGKEKFWSDYGINPYDAAIGLLSSYLETAPVDYEEALHYLNKIVEQKDRWDDSTTIPRYKNL